MADDREIDEAILVVIAIFSLLLSAAFLPAVGIEWDDSGFNIEFVEQEASQSQGVLQTQPRANQPTGQGQSGTQGNSQAKGQSKTQQQGQTGSAIGTPGQGSGDSVPTPPQQTAVSGTALNISQIPLFKIESAIDAYWRQTAYSTYTGTGWEQSVDTTPVAAGIPNDALTSDDTTFSYRVTLLKRARSLPTAWQPESVRLNDDQQQTTLRASSVGGIQSNRTLPEGTTYIAESASPTRDPDTLRAAEGQGPRAIRSTYTQLPQQTPGRVRSFTDELTAETETRYDRVTSVRDWLLSNKEYSSTPSIDRNGTIADQLLFAADAGYSQQFATTMAVMLRTQDIPARYVVGFANPESVGDDEYLVTTDTARAWVEVYFDGVGWVRFDPTPTGEPPGSSPDPPYEISLNRSAVVGAPVTVRVETDNTGVAGVPVYLDGERIGWTDGDGTVSTTLPYDTDVRIQAGERGIQTGATSDTSTNAVTQRATQSVASVAGSLPLPTAQLGTPVMKAITSGAAQTEQNQNGSSVLYPLQTDATLAVIGEQTVGATVRVVATIDDVPVSNATVTLNGNAVGQTNRQGYYDLSLASVSNGTHQLTVAREPVTATTTVTVTHPDEPQPEQDETTAVEPNISVSPTGIGLGVPGGPATATVTRFGDPVSGTEVTINGDSVGTTDADGRITLSLPLTNTATVATTVNGVSGQTQVGWLYVRAAGLGTGIVALLIGLGAGVRRYRSSIRLHYSTPSLDRQLFSTLPNRLTVFIVRIAAGSESGLRGLTDRIQSQRGLPWQSPASLIWLLDPRRLLPAVEAWVRRRFQEPREVEKPLTQQAVGAGDETEKQRGIRSLWGTFVTFVRPPNLSTRTPVEIGQYAIQRGLPKRPVQYVTDLYRAVEYGAQSPDSSRLQAAREALSEIRTEEGDGE